MWQKIKNVYHLMVALFANLYYGFPSKGMKVVAVTGTDGKTTTVNLIYHILNTSGRRVSMISSISAVINGHVYDTGFHVTTPSSLAVQKFIKKAVRDKSEFFVLETTSHAIDQNRVFGVDIEVGVLTNVTMEHLDYHKTYDKYLKTKTKILERARKCVVNSDDSSYTLLADLKKQKAKENWITYGLTESSDYNPTTFDITQSKLVGEFNKFNVLAAVAACKALGLSDGEIKKGIAGFSLPVGRADLVFDKDFRVMIDFAHTPNAFEKILSAVKPLAKGRVIHVFGSAGERDKTKRPFLGEISSKYSDVVVLTAEDPRSEDVDRIIREIEEGIKKSDAKVIKIPKRQEAIETAIEMAKKGDLVLITGKAQEGSMAYGANETPWNEFEAVEKALRKRHEN